MLCSKICPGAIHSTLNHCVCILRDYRISSLRCGSVCFKGWCFFTWKHETIYFIQIVVFFLLLRLEVTHHTLCQEVSLVFHEALHAWYSRIILKRVQALLVKIERRLVSALNDRCIVTNVTLLEQHCILTLFHF